MILRYFYFPIIAMLAILPAAAQPREAHADTLSFVLRDAVTVTATRLPTALRDAPAPAEIFDARTIRALPLRSISDVIALSAGAAVRDYGGTGSLQLASLRGLGAEYTLVLLDGMRLNSAQNSLVDVGQFTLRNVDRVEIVRGGLASLYGSNALGGVVNIVTTRERPPLTADLGYGAFGWKQAALGSGIAGRRGRLFAEARYEESDNDFSFDWNGTPLRRANSTLLRRSITAGGTLLLARSVLTLHADVMDVDMGTPGAVFSAAQGRARQRDRHAIVSVQLDAQAAPRTRLRAALGARTGRQEFTDPDYRIGNTTLRSVYDLTQLSASASVEHAVVSEVRAIAGIEGSVDRLDGAGIAAHPTRVQAAAFTSTDIPVRIRAIALHIYPALRYDMIHDAVTDTEPPDDLHALSPSIGLHLGVLPGRLALRGRIARTFGMPTFNQLYWREGGNPALRPEYSTAIDAGIAFDAGTGRPAVELTWFHHDISDKIVWTPSAGIFWTPRNVQHVISTGVEAQARFDWQWLALRASAQWMRARKVNAAFAGDATQDKQLIYVPAWSGALTLATAPAEWLTITLAARLLGTRFYDETNTAALPAHLVTDLAVRATTTLTGLETTWKLELLNALDGAYEVVAFYPMPGRHLRLSVGTTIR